MITIERLKCVLDEFEVDTESLLENGERVLERGYESRIRKLLMFLRRELHVPAYSIEKCPSILYRNTKDIIDNYDYLISKGFTSNDIETSLHILTTNRTKLILTTEHAIPVYGVERLRRIPSVLTCDRERFEEFETCFLGKLDKELILSAIKTRKSVNEINRIVTYCEKNSIPIAATMLQRTPANIKNAVKTVDGALPVTGALFSNPDNFDKNIVDLCREYGVECSASMFMQPFDEVRAILDISKKYDVPIIKNMFKKKSEEVEAIIKLCKKANIAITGSVFNRSPKEIEDILISNKRLTSMSFKKSNSASQDILEVCKKHNVEFMDNMVKRTSTEIDKLLTYCENKGIKITASAFDRPFNEAQTVYEILETHHLPIMGGAFLKTPDKTLEIIIYCEENGIKITGSIFLTNIDELKSSADYIRDNYGVEYLTPTIVSLKKSQLKTVMPIVDSWGVLPYIIVSPAILTLSKEEIAERRALIDELGENILVNGRINPMFGLTKKRYREKLETLKNRKTI